MNEKFTTGVSEELRVDIELLESFCAGARERIRQMPLKRDMTMVFWQEQLKELESDLFYMEADLARALKKVEKAKLLAERLAKSLVVSSFGRPCIIIKPRRSWVKGSKGVTRCRKCKTAISVGYSMSLVGGGRSDPIAFCECDRDDTRDCEVMQ